MPAAIMASLLAWTKWKTLQRWWFFLNRQNEYDFFEFEIIYVLIWYVIEIAKELHGNRKAIHSEILVRSISVSFSFHLGRTKGKPLLTLSSTVVERIGYCEWGWKY